MRDTLMWPRGERRRGGGVDRPGRARVAAETTANRF